MDGERRDGLLFTVLFSVMLLRGFRCNIVFSTRTKILVRETGRRGACNGVGKFSSYLALPVSHFRAAGLSSSLLNGLSVHHYCIQECLSACWILPSFG